MVAVCLFGAGRGAVADELDQTVADLRTGYGAELEKLAAWCDAEGLAPQARYTRAWLAPRDPYQIYLAALPDQVGPREPPPGTPPAVADWYQRLTALRGKQAEALYELARRVVRRRPSMAYDLVLAAARENPDHAEVRRILGYEPYEGRWRTFWEVRRLKAGWVDPERFGWLPKAYAERYERGERYYGGRWLTADQDARLHPDIDRGWNVETEHYVVRTDHSLEAGVALGRKLEGLLRVWQQLFLGYYATEAQVVSLFDARARAQRAELPRFQVVYFRDRDEYIRTLKPSLENVEISIGVYLDRQRRAYFFAGREADDRTLYHEATHQLFHQSRPVSPNVGRRANFWIIEGVAMLMETLRREGDFYVLGGLDDVRFHAAQYRLINDNFYVPFAEAAGWGMQRIQADPRIATLYSQFAGQTFFLIFYDGGRYRDALVNYLSAVYSGRDDPATLARLTGAGYADLDRQYREFITRAAQAQQRRPAAKQ